MQNMEIRNAPLVVYNFEVVPLTARTLPSTIMMIACTKGFVFLGIQILLLVLSVCAGYRVATVSERQSRRNSISSSHHVLDTLSAYQLDAIAKIASTPSTPSEFERRPSSPRRLKDRRAKPDASSESLSLNPISAV